MKKQNLIVKQAIHKYLEKKTKENLRAVEIAIGIEDIQVEYDKIISKKSLLSSMKRNWIVYVIHQTQSECK